MTLEEVFQDIGGFNRFQLLLILFVYGLKFFSAWSMLLVTFAGVTPAYNCLTPGENTTNLTFNQSRYDVINVCRINGTACTDFLFQSSPRTIISEWSLVCGLKWVKSLIVSIQMAGVLVGAAVAGQTGDTYGRKNTIYSFFLLQWFVNLLGAFSVSWQMFCAVRFFIGASVGAVLVTSVPFCSEFLPLRWRVVIVTPLWAIGGGVFAGAAWVLRDWSHLHLATAAICLPSLFGYFYFPESVRWLAVKGRLDEAHVALEKMAKMNRKTVPGYAKDVLQKIYNDEKESKLKHSTYSYHDVFKTWKLAKTTCIFSFQWITMTMVFYGLTFATPSLAGNLYLNMFIINTIEIPSSLAVVYFCNKFGRGNVCRSLMSISCLSSFGCLAARTWAPALQAPLIVTGLSIVAKLGVGASFGCCNVWMGEIYPTVIRSLAYGVTNTLARVGGILSPYAVNLDDRVVLSYVIMGSMSGLCVLLMMFVEETKDSPLHESLHQVDVKIGAHRNGVHKQASAQLHVDMNELNVLGDDAEREAKRMGGEPNGVGDKSWNQEKWQLVSMNKLSSLENVDHDRLGDGDLKNDVVTPIDYENDNGEAPRENGDYDAPNENENCDLGLPNTEEKYDVGLPNEQENCDVSWPNKEENCDVCLPNENITCSSNENNIEEFNQRL